MVKQKTILFLKFYSSYESIYWQTVFAIWSTCSIQFVLSHIDNAIQYGEDAEPKARDHDPDGDDGGGF